VEKVAHIAIAQFDADPLSSEERRIANDEFRLWPGGFYRIAVRVMGENRVPMLDVIQLANAVVIEPLQVANPNPPQRPVRARRRSFPGRRAAMDGLDAATRQEGRALR